MYPYLNTNSNTDGALADLPLKMLIFWRFLISILSKTTSMEEACRLEISKVPKANGLPRQPGN